MKLVRQLAPAIVVALASVTAVAQPSDICSKLLPLGAYDAKVSNSLQTLANEAMHAICTSDAKTKDDATRVTAKIPLPNVPGFLGIDAGGKSFEEWKSASCGHYFSHNKSAYFANTTEHKPTDQFAAIAAACGQVHGVQAFVVRGVRTNPNFAVNIQYRQIDMTSARQVTAFLTPTDATCNTTKVLLLPNSAVTVACTATGPNGQVVVAKVEPGVPIVTSTLAFDYEPPLTAACKNATAPARKGNPMGFALPVGCPGPVKVSVEADLILYGSGYYTYLALVEFNNQPACESTAIRNHENGETKVSCERVIYTRDGAVEGKVIARVLSGSATLTEVRLKSASAEPLHSVQKAPPGKAGR